MIVFRHLQCEKRTRKIFDVRTYVQTGISEGIVEHLIPAFSVNFRGPGNDTGMAALPRKRCFNF